MFKFADLNALVVENFISNRTQSIALFSKRFMLGMETMVRTGLTKIVFYIQVLYSGFLKKSTFHHMSFVKSIFFFNSVRFGVE